MRCGADGLLRQPLGSEPSTRASRRRAAWAASAAAAAAWRRCSGGSSGAASAAGVVALEEAGVGLAGGELLVGEHAHEEVAVGRQPVDLARRSASASLRTASARVAPCAITLAIIGS